MSDIGNKPIEKRVRLQVGDRVEVGEPNTEDYDTGTVVAFTFNGCRVYWDLADEVYSEDPSALRRLPAPNAKAVVQPDAEQPDAEQPDAVDASANEGTARYVLDFLRQQPSRAELEKLARTLNIETACGYQTLVERVRAWAEAKFK